MCRDCVLICRHDSETECCLPVVHKSRHSRRSWFRDFLGTKLRHFTLILGSLTYTQDRERQCCLPVVWQDVGRPPSQPRSARRGTWKSAASCRRSPAWRAWCRTSADAADSDSAACACAVSPAHSITTASIYTAGGRVAYLDFNTICPAHFDHFRWLYSHPDRWVPLLAWGFLLPCVPQKTSTFLFFE